MRLEIGTHVQTSDGQDAGTIDRLILDPATNRIKAAVLRKGLFLPHDTEVPVDMLEPGPDDTARLTCTAEQAAAFPEFFEATYTATPPAGAVPPLGYPPGAFYWPAGYGAGWPSPTAGALAGTAVGREADAALRRQDVENAVVGEGSAVLDRDGAMVGAVHRLVFDAATERLTRLVVRRGVIFTTDVELPATLIARVDDGAVSLGVTAAELSERRGSAASDARRE